MWVSKYAYLREAGRCQRLVGLWRNKPPWDKKEDNTWLAFVVVAFDAMMCQVAGGAEVAGAMDVINFDSSATVDRGGAAVAEDHH